MGGAGNKVGNLIQGQVDCYIHPIPGLMYWDLCAPESLVKGMGGQATNLAQHRLLYGGSNHKIQGLVCAKTPHMYNLIQSRIGAKLLNIARRVKL